MPTSASFACSTSPVALLTRSHIYNARSNFKSLYASRSTAACSYSVKRRERHLSKRSSGQSAAREFPKEQGQQSTETGKSSTSVLESIIGSSNSWTTSVPTTPLEIEILRGHDTSVDAAASHGNGFDTRSNRGLDASSQTLAEIRARNMQMLDFYDNSAQKIGEYPSARSTSASKDHSEAELAQNNTTSLSAASSEASLTRINALLLEVGLNNPNTSRQLVFDLYCRLPQPGVVHLRSKTREQLMMKLSQIGNLQKDERAMMQYLSAFDDLHLAGVKPKLWQWAAAMHLTGRCFKKVTTSELENAIRIWKRMEEDAGIRSNTQTMNILFDIALKADQVRTAEMILSEMRQRKLKFNRVTYLGIIYLNGLNGSGDGIRNAYKDFVEADEIVDTMTLTCVINAFLRADELPAAMNVYQRMLQRGGQERIKDQTSPQQAWEMGRLLNKFTPRHKQDPVMIANIQGDVSVRPNLITYVNLISYHANRSGEMMAIATLVDEMHECGVPMHGCIFIELFRAFSQHGNKMFTSWTKERLEEVWKAFKRLADSGHKDIFVGPAIAVPILEAFKECFGRQRACEVLEELRTRWRILDEKHQFDEYWLRSTTGILYEVLNRRPPDIMGFLNR